MWGKLMNDFSIIPTSVVMARYREGKYDETGLTDTDDFDMWLQHVIEQAKNEVRNGEQEYGKNYQEADS